MSLFVRNLRYWLPVSLWLVVIAIESFFLSSNVTGGWLWRLFRELHISISWHMFERLHHLLRKGGHFAGYGILCVLTFRACYHSISGSMQRKVLQEARRANQTVRLRCTSLALSMTLLTAILDEWHQSFDPTRTGSVQDVALDVFGGLIFLSIALYVFKLWRELPLRELETVSV